MVTTVRRTADAKQVLEEAGDFLAGDPVRHNVILTLLHSRLTHPEPGRYWIVDVDSRADGVVFQSPLHFAVTLTPMSAETMTAAVEAIVEDGVHVPGVNAEAATAARFAGLWTERTKSGARPTQGQRIYEVDHVAVRPANGSLRAATPEDHDLLVTWFDGFLDAIGEPARDNTDVVAHRLAAGHLWIWDDDAPVAMAGLFDAVSGVARIGPVYTPSDRRGHGYASALVAAVSDAVRSRGDRCILYTDLQNPTSNSIYRAIGYRAVAEVLHYRFDD